MSDNPLSCPDCAGLGYKEIPIVCMGCDEHHEHGEPERVICGTCRGAKVLSALALAVYTARGGPAPPMPMRGFA